LLTIALVVVLDPISLVSVLALAAVVVLVVIALTAISLGTVSIVVTIGIVTLSVVTIAALLLVSVADIAKVVTVSIAALLVSVALIAVSRLATKSIESRNSDAPLAEGIVQATAEASELLTDTSSDVTNLGAKSSEPPTKVAAAIAVATSRVNKTARLDRSKLGSTGTAHHESCSEILHHYCKYFNF